MKLPFPLCTTPKQNFVECFLLWLRRRRVTVVSVPPKKEKHKLPVKRKEKKKSGQGKRRRRRRREGGTFTLTLRRKRGTFFSTEIPCSHPNKFGHQRKRKGNRRMRRQKEEREKAKAICLRFFCVMMPKEFGNSKIGRLFSLRQRKEGRGS